MKPGEDERRLAQRVSFFRSPLRAPSRTPGAPPRRKTGLPAPQVKRESASIHASRPRRESRGCAFANFDKIRQIQGRYRQIRSYFPSFFDPFETPSSIPPAPRFARFPPPAGALPPHREYTPARRRRRLADAGSCGQMRARLLRGAFRRRDSRGMRPFPGPGRRPAGGAGAVREPPVSGSAAKRRTGGMDAPLQTPSVRRRDANRGAGGGFGARLPSPASGRIMGLSLARAAPFA